MTLVGLALVGCGQIAREQHARVLLGESAAETGFRLIATVDPGARLPGFDGPHYADLSAMLRAEPGVTAVSVATPTGTHFDIAREALRAGRHVLLEKPPTTTLGALSALERIAADQGKVLVTSFHSRHNEAVERLRAILSARRAPERIRVAWREDFDRWHPGQVWPWRVGGFGVLDPGINALAILCHLLPDLDFRVDTGVRFKVYANSATPAAVDMRLSWEGGCAEVGFEWRRGGQDGRGGQDVWDIEIDVATHDGTGRESYVLRDVRTLLRNGTIELASTQDKEYLGVYRNFNDAIGNGVSQISRREMQILEDATMIAEVDRQDSPF